jgi:hypothetical protein
MNSLTDYIKVYPNTIPSEICEFLISVYDENEEAAYQYASKYLDQGSQPKKMSFTSMCQDESMKAIHRNIGVCLERCLQDYIHTLNYDVNCFPAQHLRGYEEILLKKYNQGIDTYITHADTSQACDGNRVLSAVLYLNDVEEGGETVFPDMGYSIKPKRGSLALFPSSWMYPHSANVPISSAKYILVSFIRFTTLCNNPDICLNPAHEHK